MLTKKEKIIELENVDLYSLHFLALLSKKVGRDRKDRKVKGNSYNERIYNLRYLRFERSIESFEVCKN